MSEAWHQLPRESAAECVFSDTEIDWETYMYQLELFMKGERDYALISGPTGPLV